MACQFFIFSALKDVFFNFGKLIPLKVFQLDQMNQFDMLKFAYPKPVIPKPLTKKFCDFWSGFLFTTFSC